ncbi:RNA polymerase sigma factor [Actinopolymorpha alba]|uniref:RNA polymerase sigma factor n=1 Tax=Actinopolymorpha alba TaxID=533267 RepID=UPI000365F73C|nr:RNA polymerase sigma factor [Actinopolymorpha alba]
MADRKAEARFIGLYRDNYGRVLRFVMRRVGDESEAEDLAAEVFKIAWARTVDGSSPLSPGWLFVTAQNLLRNHHRSLFRSERLLQAAEAELKTRQTTPSSVEIVQAVVSSLDEHHRQVLVLAYWDGLSAREIAEVMQVSVSAVWVRMHRARRAFRDSFQGQVGRTE